MVLVSAITCLTLLHSLGSVGAGTIIAAILVGTLVGIINQPSADNEMHCLVK